MAQTLLSLILELRPASVMHVQDILARWRDNQEQRPDRYSEMRIRMPGLHFMSFTVFTDSQEDPILAIEANTDDEAKLFWHRLAAAYSDILQTIVLSCKRPAGRAGSFLDAAVRSGATDSVAAFLQHLSQRPVAGHQGHRGLTRARIEQEAALFTDMQTLLGQRTATTPATAIGLHAELRAALLPAYPWLGHSPPARIPLRERLGDVVSLMLALALLMFILSLPGLLLLSLNTTLLLTVTTCVGVTASWVLWRGLSPDDLRQAKRAKAELTLILQHAAPVLVSTSVQIAGATLFAVFYVLVSSLIAAGAFWTGGDETFSAAYVEGFRTMTLGLISLGATLPMLLLWIRRVEASDPVQGEVAISPDGLASFERAEDQITQNHMASVVMVKPGVLRAVLIRAGLRGLGLLLRVLATDGYLGSMRTIHFAHWTLAGDGGRLVFFSNFDGSWRVTSTISSRKPMAACRWRGDPASVFRAAAFSFSRAPATGGSSKRGRGGPWRRRRFGSVPTRTTPSIRSNARRRWPTACAGQHSQTRRPPHGSGRSSASRAGQPERLASAAG